MSSKDIQDKINAVKLKLHEDPNKIELQDEYAKLQMALELEQGKETE